MNIHGYKKQIEKINSKIKNTRKIKPEELKVLENKKRKIRNNINELRKNKRSKK